MKRYNLVRGPHLAGMTEMLPAIEGHWVLHDQAAAELATRDAEIARLLELVKSAYREGRGDGYCHPSSDTWPQSETRAALDGGKGRA